MKHQKDCPLYYDCNKDHCYSCDSHYDYSDELNNIKRKQEMELSIDG